MLKSIIVFFVFCLLVATIKESKSVREIEDINKIYCKDICK